MYSQTGNTSIQKINLQFKVVSGLAIDSNLEPYMRMQLMLLIRTLQTGSTFY